MDKNRISQEALNSLLEKFSEQSEFEVKSGFKFEILDDNSILFSIKGTVVGNTNSEVIFNKICMEISDTHQHIIFDLKECPYLSSFFLGAVAQLATKHAKIGYKIFFVNISKITYDLIKLSNMDYFITIANSVDDAISIIRGQ